jgi:ubiquitin-conjugating enzyme E2 T
MTRVRAHITGPEDSPFDGGVFLLVVNITARYPFEPPRCRFATPMHHPNVDSGGRICLDTLKSPPAGSWSPAVSLPSLLLGIRSLMAEPNPDDGLVPGISEQYKRDPSGWRGEARRRTREDATPRKLEEAESSLDRRDDGGRGGGGAMGGAGGGEDGDDNMAGSENASAAAEAGKSGGGKEGAGDAADRDGGAGPSSRGGTGGGGARTSAEEEEEDNVQNGTRHKKKSKLCRR